MSKTMSTALSEANRGTGWKGVRRRAARDAIVESAWELAREQGLPGLSMRELARRAGMTTPTLYAYFDSKNAIYDAMFGQAATLFLAHMSAAPAADIEHPAEYLEENLLRFVAFCTEDVTRYQLLFQRVIPGFEPAEQSYAPAVEALSCTKARLAELGCGGAEKIDMWTALVTGLVDQQISNDPGGDRWTRLSRQFVDMFVAYCRPETTIDKKSRKGAPR